MNKEKTGLRAEASKAVISFLAIVYLLVSYQTALAQQPERMVRISEIEIDPAFLEAYKTILAEESAASVKLEPGVIAIFPMYQKENPTSVRILEMYASKTAYEQHLKTSHFLKYKTTTLKMVKSLKLVDMGLIDVDSMPLLFRKVKEDK
ncbi:putative quinol monooxygenase [Larkinella punicea]|uniref:Antibiotic biosynthesis monooxygenase n=1 Tax=Larkinella punicea TaxID=2315727 RepID=A0A368JPV1_9BACT|nr:antibiotic biosynthesis monooxygenase family protein [Larkinella punicea]RCR69522.1 antibiotic biosynthesis monooxygenase [Larkinella punicea]